MAKTISLACLQSRQQRQVNEDNIYFLDHYVAYDERPHYEESAASQQSRQCFAVADGLGGEGLADIAADVLMHALDTLMQTIRTSPRFDFVSFSRDLVDQGNRAIAHHFQDFHHMQIGTSFSLLMIDQDTAYTVALGNSPVFLFRNQRLHRLTRDHIKETPEGRQLSRYLGIPAQPGLTDNDNLTRTLLEKGDVLLLMTDGAANFLSEEQIRDTLNRPQAFVQQIKNLRDSVLAQGDNDDLALIGIKVLDPKIQLEDELIRGGKRGMQRSGFAKKEKSRNQAAALPDASRQKQRQKRQPVGSGGQKNSEQAYHGHKQVASSKEKVWRILKPIIFYLAFVGAGFLGGQLLFSLLDKIG